MFRFVFLEQGALSCDFVTFLRMKLNNEMLNTRKYSDKCLEILAIFKNKNPAAVNSRK